MELRELRGHIFGPDGDLYVANAFRNDSQILRFHGRLNREGKHEFREAFIHSDPLSNPGLSHPFSLAFSAEGDLFVSSQNTSLVLRYHGPLSTSGEPGKPMPSPPFLTAIKNAALSPGTYCAPSEVISDGLKVVRKAVFAAGHLYVADRDADCIRKFDSASGAFLGAIASRHLIDKPIHLVADNDALYIGSRGSDGVARCDLRSESVSAFVHAKAGGLKNPAGLALGNDGYFYVASRSTKQILRFRASDGAPDAGPFIDGLEDEPEFFERVPE